MRIKCLMIFSMIILMSCDETKTDDICLNNFKNVEYVLDEMGNIVSATFNTKLENLGMARFDFKDAIHDYYSTDIEIKGLIGFERGLLPNLCLANFMFTESTIVGDWDLVMEEEVRIKVMPIDLAQPIFVGNHVADSVRTLYLVESVVLSD